MFTLSRIAFATAARRMFTHTNGDFGAISITVQRCHADGESHISDISVTYHRVTYQSHIRSGIHTKPGRFSCGRENLFGIV